MVASALASASLSQSRCIGRRLLAVYLAMASASLLLRASRRRRAACAASATAISWPAGSGEVVGQTEADQAVGVNQASR